MLKIAKFIGVIGSIGSLLLVTVLLFFNPYDSGFKMDVLLNFFAMSILPGIVALMSSLRAKPKFLFISFIWSLPIGFYLTGTPGIFKWILAGSALYLVSGILMVISKKKTDKKQSLFN
ncbi:hypothetical protein ACFFIX_25805 [Metabacillus herbersteinensis]|uniref:DUF3021 domain-containing protein n=1 Tax=Metabacillus herbersteinensis TaxID=283816 RepID=A0ABV6GM22_9BACI